MLFTLSTSADAQQAKTVPRVGFIGASSPATAGYWLEAFRKGFHELGYIEGKNITFEIRWAQGSAQRFPELIAELNRLSVDVMVVSAATGALAAKNARIGVPIVFAAVTDPLGNGIVESLARPGGNITGTALAVGEGFAGNGLSC
jgi:putative tryptophan/tyrosine transport system substrate-binding protein